MHSLIKNVYVLIMLFFLVACGQREGLAPVVELNWREANHKQLNHVVVRGETLYAIAFRYDQDYRQLAKINHLSNPYTLHVGQVIHLQQRVIIRKQKREFSTSPFRPSPRPIKYNEGIQTWVWPVRGRIVASFIPNQGKKGIDIAGKKGDKIRAASSGVVAYAGSGLQGYGNLIIIKHNNQYLTAYGHNLRNLVHEGQMIKVGQNIAEIGVVGRRFWGVHFEIRKSGQPVNPLNYLEKY